MRLDLWSLLLLLVAPLLPALHLPVAFPFFPPVISGDQGRLQLWTGQSHLLSKMNLYPQSGFPAAIIMIVVLAAVSLDSVVSRGSLCLGALLGYIP